jgi:hypothetical protein
MQVQLRRTLGKDPESRLQQLDCRHRKITLDGTSSDSIILESSKRRYRASAFSPTFSVIIFLSSSGKSKRLRSSPAHRLVEYHRQSPISMIFDRSSKACRTHLPGCFILLHSLGHHLSLHANINESIDSLSRSLTPRSAPL